MISWYNSLQCCICAKNAIDKNLVELRPKAHTIIFNKYISCLLSEMNLWYIDQRDITNNITNNSLLYLKSAKLNLILIILNIFTRLQMDECRLLPFSRM